MNSTTRNTSFPSEWLIGQSYDPNENLIKIERYDKRTQVKTISSYLNVQNRLLWFVADQRRLIAEGLATTTYAITTELVELDRQQGWAHFKTSVRDVLGNEATMYGSEAASDFPDYIEKASTKSLGRALSLLGYGTAFAPELDEGERVVDAPLPAPARQSTPAPQPIAPAPRVLARPATTTPVTGASDTTRATERQITSIRKLCAALGRTEPDLIDLTFSDARVLLTQLSQAYRESAKAS